MNDRFKISGGGGGVIRWKNDQFIIEGSFKGLIIAIDASCALISCLLQLELDRRDR